MAFVYFILNRNQGKVELCPVNLQIFLTVSVELQHLLDIIDDTEGPESQNVHQRASLSLDNFWWRVGQGSHIQQAPHPPGKHVWGEALILDSLNFQVGAQIYKSWRNKFWKSFLFWGKRAHLTLKDLHFIHSPLRPKINRNCTISIYVKRSTL